MARHQDFGDQASRDAYLSRQPRVEVADNEDGESWAVHIALILALAIAMTFSTFF